MKNKIFKIYLRINFIFSKVNAEAFIWISGIILLFIIDNSGENHFTVCPIKNLGIGFCPGCGLGTSIHHILHFNIKESLAAHPLGIFALLILFHRIYALLKNNFSIKKILS